jgi:hypothetical protein
VSFFEIEPDARAPEGPACIPGWILNFDQAGYRTQV